VTEKGIKKVSEPFFGRFHGIDIVEFNRLAFIDARWDWVHLVEEGEEGLRGFREDLRVLERSL
jgi:hypothetical protein